MWMVSRLQTATELGWELALVSIWQVRLRLGRFGSYTCRDWQGGKFLLNHIHCCILSFGSELRPTTVRSDFLRTFSLNFDTTISMVCKLQASQPGRLRLDHNLAAQLQREQAPMQHLWRASWRLSHTALGQLPAASEWLLCSHAFPFFLNHTQDLTASWTVFGDSSLCKWMYWSTAKIDLVFTLLSIWTEILNYSSMHQDLSVHFLHPGGGLHL